MNQQTMTSNKAKENQSDISNAKSNMADDKVNPREETKVTGPSAADSSVTKLH